MSLPPFPSSAFWEAGTWISPSGYIALGASPPATGAIRIDASGYGNIGINLINGAIVIGTDPGGTAPLRVGGSITMSNGASLYWAGRSQIASGTDGIISLYNNAASDFSRLTFGGVSASFPSLRRSGSSLQCRLADDAGYADFAALGYFLTSGTQLRSTVDGILLLQNNAATDFTRLQFGGTTASFPAIRRTSANLDFVLADDTAYCNVNAAKYIGQYLQLTGTITLGGTANINKGIEMTITNLVPTSGAGYAMLISPTITAAVNADSLYGLYLNPTYTHNSKTGLITKGIVIPAWSVAAYTTPGAAKGIEVGIITGKAGMTTTALELGIPTGGDTNYLIAASTPATFNVLADGSVSLASTSTLNVGAGGSASSSVRIQKAISSIADNTFTTVFTVTIPNAAHSAFITVRFQGTKGANDAEGACGSVSITNYTFSVQRTAGVTTTVGTSTAFGAAVCTIAAGNAVTTTAQASAVSGAVGATQTFTIQVKVARAAGSSTNHTCFAVAELQNANGTGITIA